MRSLTLSLPHTTFCPQTGGQRMAKTQGFKPSTFWMGFWPLHYNKYNIWLTKYLRVSFKSPQDPEEPRSQNQSSSGTHRHTRVHRRTHAYTHTHTHTCHKNLYHGYQAGKKINQSSNQCVVWCICV